MVGVIGVAGIGELWARGDCGHRKGVGIVVVAVGQVVEQNVRRRRGALFFVRSSGYLGRLGRLGRRLLSLSGRRHDEKSIGVVGKSDPLGISMEDCGGAIAV